MVSLVSFEGETSRIRLDPYPGDNDERWRFWQLRPSAEHVLAIAAEVPAGERCELEVRQVVPSALSDE